MIGLCILYNMGL